jgi:uncharacterized membrane protein YeiB
MFLKLFETTKDFLKINAIALLIIGLMLTVMALLFLPKEKQTDQQLAKKFTEITAQYDEATKSYRDVELADKLQREAVAIQNDNKIIKLLKVVVVSIFLGVITSGLAWLMQFLFTTIKFTQNNVSKSVGSKNITPIGDPMRVLTAALWTATAIVCVVFVVVYSA